MPRRRPSRIGQNFLADHRVARRIVRAASLEPGDHVLEIGPGRGALTRPLLDAASRVVAVEIDESLAAVLSERFRDEPNFELVAQDALEFEPGEYFSRPYKFVANLPYYVATPIIRRMLAARPAPTLMTVMVQREVAAAMTAPPGRMTLLSVMIQTHAAARVLFTVPPRAFRPQPKVTSAVVRIDPYAAPAAPAVPVADPSAFIDFAAAGFRAPRKQIRNSLSLGLDASPSAIQPTLDAAGVDARRRPSTLTLTEWANLYNAWTDMN